MSGIQHGKVSPMLKGAYRLGFGELSPPEVVQWEARNTFLYLIQHETPEVLKDLAGTPWLAYDLLLWEVQEYRQENGSELFRQRYGDEAFLFALHPETFDEWMDQASEVLDPHLLRLRRALQQWQEKYQIQAPWVTEQALWTLGVWHRAESIRETLFGKSWGVYSPLTTSPPEGQVSLRGLPSFTYGPTEETRSQALKRMLARVEEHIRRELERIEKELQSSDPNLIKTPAKRNRSGDPLLHYRWTVLAYVRRMSWREIADATDPDARVTEDAIRKAVEATANELGLLPQN